VASDHEKYIVRKVGDHPDHRLKPGTFFVIRSQDMFGIAGLYAYASQIQTILELNQTRPILTPVEQDHLQGVADYVADLARQWQEQQTKVPD
jgi:hypothetical protein